MLELDVDKRLTASQALAHPFFEPFRDPEEETEAQKFDDSLEHEKLTVDEWKRKSWGLGLLPLSACSLSVLRCLFSRLPLCGPLCRPLHPPGATASFPLSRCGPCVHFFLPELTYNSMLCLWGQGASSFWPSAPPPHLEPPCLS